MVGVTAKGRPFSILELGCAFRPNPPFATLQNVARSEAALSLAGRPMPSGGGASPASLVRLARCLLSVARAET